MYPHNVELLGRSVSIWNTVFLAAAFAGCLTLRASTAAEPRLNFFVVRCLVSLYLIVLGGQLFAYAFDANTALRPPYEIGYAAYYLNPLAGPKTLYGAIVLAPVAVWVAKLGSGVGFARALDLWTPALFTVVAGARIGCFLQGCCYGVRSDLLGMSFPVGSPVYYEQLRAGLISAGSPSLGVVPTQAIEAVMLALIAAVSLKLVRDEATRGRPVAETPLAGAAWPSAGDGAVFGAAIAVYSVFRFAIEFVRGDVERGIYHGLATSQWIAILVLASSLVALRRRVRT